MQWDQTRLNVNSPSRSTIKKDPKRKAKEDAEKKGDADFFNQWVKTNRENMIKAASKKQEETLLL